MIVRVVLLLTLTSLLVNASPVSTNTVRKLNELTKNGLKTKIEVKDATAVFRREFCIKAQLFLRPFFGDCNANKFVTDISTECRRYNEAKEGRHLAFTTKLVDFVVASLKGVLPMSCNKKMEQNRRINESFMDLLQRHELRGELKEILDQESGWPLPMKLPGTRLQKALCDHGDVTLHLCNKNTALKGTLVKISGRSLMKVKGNVMKEFTDLPPYVLISPDGSITAFENSLANEIMCDRFETRCQLPSLNECTAT